MIQIVDTHCHLVSEKLHAQAEVLVAQAHEAGVVKIINIAYDPPTIQKALEQAQHFSQVYCALGIQPHDADTFTEEEALRVTRLAQTQKKVVAIGEIGLDAFHKLVDLPLQIKCFERFLEVALEVKLPVAVHLRETHRDVWERLRDFSKRGGTGEIHCFTGSRDEAREFLDIGFYLSFSGIVTFKNSLELKEVATFVPADSFLIETDSPYLAPVPQRGKTNQPAWTRHVAEHIAELRQTSLEDICAQTWENTHRLFPKLGLSNEFTSH
jgi:TatD DNase family protein